MSQNPYAGQYDLPEQVVPERTSIMAILSLVFGILCVPLFGLIAIFLGVFAMFGIKASRGRVSGTGLAVAGVVLGIIATLIWGGCVGTAYVGIKALEGEIGPRITETISSIQNNDASALSAKLDPSVRDQLGPETIQNFRDSYVAKHGEFERLPQGIAEWFEAYSILGPQMQGLQGRQYVIPFPGKFQNGWALILVELNVTQPDPSAQPGALPIANIVISDGSSEIKLLSGVIAPVPAVPSLPDADADAPADGEPADAEPADAEPEEGGGG